MSVVVEQGVFRAALGRFASGVTVVSTVEAGIDHAMTASAFTSVSLDPPLVLVCSHKTSRFHDAVLKTGVWGVSVLAEEGIASSAWLAHRGRPLDAQLEGISFHRGVSGVALLDESLSWLECTTRAFYDGGDHTILVGAVTSAGVREGDDDPLLYYRSHYGTMVRLPDSEKTVYGEHA